MSLIRSWHQGGWALWEDWGRCGSAVLGGGGLDYRPSDCRRWWRVADGRRPSSGDSTVDSKLTSFRAFRLPEISDPLARGHIQMIDTYFVNVLNI
jgi:hypothetical protein